MYIAPCPGLSPTGLVAPTDWALRRLRTRMNTANNAAMVTTAAPTAIPAMAPVERPPGNGVPLGGLVDDVVVDLPEVEVAAEVALLVDLLELLAVAAVQENVPPTLPLIKSCLNGAQSTTLVL
jgi:hypothetical protein